MKKNFDFPIRDGRRVLLGVGVGLVVMLATAGGIAWLVYRGMLGREHLSIASAVILVLGSLLGALSTGRGEGRLVRCFVVGVGIVLALLLMNLLLFDGNLRGLLPGLLVIAGGAGAAALLGGGSSSRRHRKYRYPKYANR